MEDESWVLAGRIDSRAPCNQQVLEPGIIDLNKTAKGPGGLIASRNRQCGNSLFAAERRYFTSIVDTLSGGSDNCNVEPFTGIVETSTGATSFPACTCACAEAAVI